MGDSMLNTGVYCVFSDNECRLNSRMHLGIDGRLNISVYHGMVMSACSILECIML